MSTSPGVTPVTVPVAETVAIAGFDDCHVAWLVTSCTAPFDSVAIALNCADAPMAGVVPVIVMLPMVGPEGEEGVLLPQWLRHSANARIAAKRAAR